MKSEITPRRNLEILSRYIIDGYAESAVKERGVIQLDLTHDGEDLACTFTADGKILAFGFGRSPRCDVRLTAGLYDWLDLAAGRLHPVRGVMARRLRFDGDTRMFGRLLDRKAMFDVRADLNDPPRPHELNPIRTWRRPENILVINGSPRGRGGYTHLYLNRFLQGLQSAGGTVETIELGRKNVNPCTGCMHCWKNDTGRCVQADDGNELISRFVSADLVVFAFTLYWDGVPGILKNFIERLFYLEQPYMVPGMWKTRHPRRIKRDQSLFIFSVCGFPEQSHFDPVRLHFRSISHNAHMANLGGIYRSACMFLHNNPLYFRTYNRVLSALATAGSELYRFGKISARTLAAAQTRIDPRAFRGQASKYWENVVLKKDGFPGSV